LAALKGEINGKTKAFFAIGREVDEVSHDDASLLQELRIVGEMQSRSNDRQAGLHAGFDHGEHQIKI
jgi:hypothetical protein